jgi:monoamine oxidase
MKDGPQIVVIGGGIAGLAAAYVLQKDGFDTEILEASHRVGGRVRTAREPFARGLYGELGAMRLPANHQIVNHYLKELGLDDQLEPFEQRNKLIYLTGLKKTITYNAFEKLLEQRDPSVLNLFPGLHEHEKGKTLHELWETAMVPAAGMDPSQIREKFDRHTLQSYLEEVAKWSTACVQLYEYCSAHVVLGNAFEESFADAYLSSEKQGAAAGMRQLKGGLDRLAWAFLEQDQVDLAARIRFGARVRQVTYDRSAQETPIRITFETAAGHSVTTHADYVVFAIPCPAMTTIRVSPPFRAGKTNAINQVRYVEVTKILAQFRTRWWESLLDQEYDAGSEGGLVTDLPIRYLVFPHSASSQFAPPQARGVVMASYTFEREAARLGVLSEPDKLRLVRENLGEIFGENLIDDTIEVSVSHNWSNDVYAGGAAFAYFSPHQHTRLYNDLVSSDWDGRACFAGEHASGYHGWIEGALRSALRAAVQVSEHFLS